jgi:caffeoyl-CoA O-methyltransferase
MDLVNILAEQYADHFTTCDDMLLSEILDFTKEHHKESHMISGKVQGQFLQVISTLVQPNFVLEIGTFTGYSALSLAVGMQPKGELHTIELREEDAKLSKSFFDKSMYVNQIHLHQGNALDVLPTLDYEWDLIFIDADKTNYCNYYDLILPKLKKGGIIIADNVLFHGQVLEENIKGKNAVAIHAFNQKIKEDKRVTQLLLTIRDGLMLIIKK